MTDHRRCEKCGGAMPTRTHRQRNQKGQLVCDSCADRLAPSWGSTQILPLEVRSELARREAEALDSILRTSRLRSEAHDSGDQALIHHCFAGETEYLTPEGVKTLAETVGTTQQVLTSPQGEKAPRWVDAEIVDFGVQPLMRVTLKRNQMTKVVHATAGHRWLVGRVGQYRVVTTENLKPEHRLASLLTPGVGDLKPDHAGIRHGVIFGDGTVARGRWARVTLWGDKDKELLSYFPGTSQRPMSTPNGISGVSITGGFTSEMKTVPSLDESDEYLYGWLAGYFAADGHVNDQGQAIIDSANIDNLYAVRDVATRLGISVYSISTRWRQGYGDEPREVSRMQFVGSTLNEDFFLIEKHRDRFRFNPVRERVGWTVVSVEEIADRIEHVYCAVVPETESFVLADNIWTMNCPFCGSGSVTGRSDGSAECDFCNSVFTVQVQPSHPNMPQTIDGRPVTPPGMPGGQETELSGTDDPTVAESEDGVATNSLDDDDPTAPKQPGAKKPNPFTKKDPQAGDNPVDKSKKKSQPPWLKSKSLRTATGATLDADAYMAHLALEATKGTPAHEAVLDTVRVANAQKQAAEEGRTKPAIGPFDPKVGSVCSWCGGPDPDRGNSRYPMKFDSIECRNAYMRWMEEDGVLGSKQAAHPDYPHGVPYECPTCGNYRTKDHCDTCTDNATYRKQRGPTFLDYLMHGLAPSGATAAKTALVVVCPECGGSGVDESGDTCWYCEGDGTVDEGSYGEAGVG